MSFTLAVTALGRNTAQGKEAQCVAVYVVVGIVVVIVVWLLYGSFVWFLCGW